MQKLGLLILFMIFLRNVPFKHSTKRGEFHPSKETKGEMYPSNYGG